MKTTAIAALLAFGTLALVAPVASADPLDAFSTNTGDIIETSSPICYNIRLVPFAYTVSAAGVSATVSSGIAQDIARGCIL